MSSKNKYIINKNKVIGEGGTSRIYLGIRSEDGCQCAMKCSNRKQITEITNMRDLDHANIIKFYDSLSDVKDFVSVIVMEYCNQGSLYEFAVLHRGLCDNMFLKVLECLHKGISYLRANQLLHRDIKPGNMMVHRDNMGYFHVKLGDLGTAKRVEDDQTFKTLVGTEEYLHPDMYIQHIGKVKSSFTTNVDLWSTGITLYHAAAAELPFLPFNYSRRHLKSQMMLQEMYRKKEPGIISGRQNTKDPNDITWSKSLPDSCRLSPMLKALASTLIGNLLDLDGTNTYERFFEDANKLSCKKRLLVFNSLNGELRILYLDTLTYVSVVDEIANTIGLAKEQLTLLTRSTRLEPPADPSVESFRSLPIKGHLRYTLTDDTVFVLLKKVDTEVYPLVNKELSTKVCNPPVAKYDKESDPKKYSEDIIRCMYQIGYAANYIDCQMDCFYAAMNSFTKHVIEDNLCLMNTALPWQKMAMLDSCTMANTMVHILEEVAKDIVRYTDMFNDMKTIHGDLEKLNIRTNEGEKGVGTFYSKIVVQGQMSKFTEEHFFIEGDALWKDSLDFLIHLAVELLNEVRMVPNESYKDKDDAYKLEVWQRHVHLYEYYKDSKERFLAKRKRINKLHHDFHDMLQKALVGLEKINIWKDFLKDKEDKLLNLRSQLLQTVDMARTHTNTPALAAMSIDPFEVKLLEIAELTDKLRKKMLPEM